MSFRIHSSAIRSYSLLGVFAILNFVIVDGVLWSCMEGRSQSLLRFFLFDQTR